MKPVSYTHLDVYKRQVSADRLHERHRREVLQTVRLDRLAGGVRLAGGGADADPDDGGLLDQTDL